MAKDPAVLWYWNDWAGGTATLTRHQKGCYMELLNAQFNNGNLSLEEIKIVLGSDFGSAWPALQKKFKQNDVGLYYNERLVFERDRRKNFSEKQREKVNKRYKPGNDLVDTEHLPIENVNEIENTNEIKKENKKIPELAEFLEHCKVVLQTRYQEYEFSLISKYETWKDQGWKDGHDSPIKNWKNKINNTIPFLKPIKNVTTKADKHRPLTTEELLESVKRGNAGAF